MKAGAQWVAFDAEFIRRPLGKAIKDRFGGDGITVFLAWVCACKTSPVPGTFIHGGTDDAMRRLGIDGLAMVAPDGSKFTVQDVFRLLAGHKQVRTRRSAGLFYVTSTSWEEWQQERGRMTSRERQRRSRAKSQRDGDVTPSQAVRDVMRDATVTDIDIDIDSKTSPPTPSESADENTPSPPAKKRGNGSNKHTNGQPADPVVAWIRRCVPGTGQAAATSVVERLRSRGVGDAVIEEAAGYAAEHGGHSATYVEQVAVDWMTQRDPTWATAHDDTEPRQAGDALKGLRR